MLTTEHVRAAGGIVHSDGNIFFTNLDKLNAACAPLLERIAELEKLRVTNIMLSINPGWDGMGEEVYAKSVADVEDKLSKMGEALEEWQLGIRRHPEMEARIAELEAKLAQRVPDELGDDDLSELAHSANEEALSFGLSHDVFLRYFKTIRTRAVAAAPAAPEQQEPTADFNDPRVQIVYNLICADEAPPNREEHWDGWVSRRIVDALFPAAQAPNAQQAEAQTVGGTSLDELSGALMNDAPLNTDQRSALYALVVAAQEPRN